MARVPPPLEPTLDITGWSDSLLRSTDVITWLSSQIEGYGKLLQDYPSIMLAAEEGPSEQPASSRENIWPLAPQPHQVTAFRRYLYGPVIAGIPLATAGPCGSGGGINSETACSSSNAGMPAQAPTHKATNRCHPMVSIIDGIKARDFGMCVRALLLHYQPTLLSP